MNKKMNKKGFTLIELLSVIVLIGIVLSIGVLSVSSIRSSILDKQYENIKTEIEIAGEKYYFDTESTQFYVQTLIDEGYLKADNESKEITNPKNSEKLNCYVVKVSNDNEKATLDVEHPGNCDVELEGNYAINIFKEDESPVEDKWYKELFKVKAMTTNIDIIDYAWTTDLNPDIIGDSQVYDLSNLLNERGGVINDIFYVSAVTNESGKVLKSGAKRIRIDKVAPKIEGNIEIPNTGWAKEKNVSITLTDVGSGISRYIFDTDSNCSSPDWTTLGTAQNRINVSKVFDSNGTYYFCAEDEAGNRVGPQTITIENIDSEPPKCDYTGEKEYYTIGTWNVKFGCKDEGSGCKEIIDYANPSKNKSCPSTEICEKLYQDYTYMGTMSTADIESTIGKFRIVDNAGNYTDCPDDEKKDLNIYLDNTAPSISVTNVSYNYGTLYVSAYVSDDHSGVSGVCISQSSSSCNNWISFSGGYYTFSYNTYLGGASYYVYAEDNVGNRGYTQVSISAISGTRSGSGEDSGPYTEYIGLYGTVLDYTYNASVGSVSCDAGGTCTVYPEDKSYSCVKSESPDTSWANQVCYDGGTLISNTCTDTTKSYKNYSGECYCWRDATHDGAFTSQSTCEWEFGSRYSELQVTYYLGGYGTYGDFGELCGDVARTESQCKNAGDDGATISGVVATKYCSFDDYSPNSYCDYDDETLIGDMCYSCSRSDSWLDTSSYTCDYYTTCPKYDYNFSYTYYVYS